MSKFNVDFSHVTRALDKRSHKFDTVKTQLEKVAWDVYRFKNAAADELWQVESTDDGDYIVALYNDEDKIATASTPIWSVKVKNSELHVWYKQDHLCKVDASELGLQPQDLTLAQRWLPAKLATNKRLVTALFNSIEPSARQTIFSKYPELS